MDSHFKLNLSFTNFFSADLCSNIYADYILMLPWEINTSCLSANITFEGKCCEDMVTTHISLVATKKENTTVNVKALGNYTLMRLCEWKKCKHFKVNAQSENIRVWMLKFD